MDVIIVSRIGATISGLLLFLSACADTRQDRFWAWFQANENRLYHFEIDQEHTFDLLGAQLARVDPNLTFEFSPVRGDGTREFIISAGGIRSAFPAVETLYASAPKLARWKWIKFRPRRVPISDISFNGRTVRAADVKFRSYRDGSRLGLLLFVDGYNDADKKFYGQACYLILDEALGEYAVETQIGAIEVRGLTDPNAAAARPLVELASDFDEFLGASRK
ncbi:MAG: hypothetical protein JSS86_00710 [Cyanobacteria bacterium SZAS LIN-2]|nr:hypothetical protein [Cyanobacteria bacterium SZAS LIN-2]